MALPFTRSADFGLTKDAGTPCPNLGADFGCGIHARLRADGFRGCSVFDCFGAGQHLSTVTFAGRDWRDDPETATAMFAAFGVLRQLHELLWYLTEALDRPEAREVHAALRQERDEVDALTREPAEPLAEVDVPALRDRIGPLLARASASVRAEIPGRARDRRGADLMGARLRGAHLRGADLRGAYLIAADLRRADLRTTDLLGADLRDCDLRGADLTGCLFLTQPQVNAAVGDAATRLPPAVDRPDHW
ncbi:pentapeptide repeat-containing protein [Saccharomonospora saliphila]|uniref:pentapeptide repeat-containing protein n=1 Tax=Saccharomonospora saliphila TaxID=369829 RepID=UPI0003676736|nr:pentapeptide repeat-containing protein [Saccharomonospora saliphila]